MSPCLANAGESNPKLSPAHDTHSSVLNTQDTSTPSAGVVTTAPTNAAQVTDQYFNRVSCSSVQGKCAAASSDPDSLASMPVLPSSAARLSLSMDCPGDLHPLLAPQSPQSLASYRRSSLTAACLSADYNIARHTLGRSDALLQHPTHEPPQLPQQHHPAALPPGCTIASSAANKRQVRRSEDPPWAQRSQRESVDGAAGAVTIQTYCYMGWAGCVAENSTPARPAELTSRGSGYGPSWDGVLEANGSVSVSTQIANVLPESATQSEACGLDGSCGRHPLGAADESRAGSINVANCTSGKTRNISACALRHSICSSGSTCKREGGIVYCSDGIVYAPGKRGNALQRLLSVFSLDSSASGITTRRTSRTMSGRSWCRTAGDHVRDTAGAGRAAAGSVARVGLGLRCRRLFLGAKPGNAARQEWSSQADVNDNDDGGRDNASDSSEVVDEDDVKLPQDLLARDSRIVHRIRLGMDVRPSTLACRSSAPSLTTSRSARAGLPSPRLVRWVSLSGTASEATTTAAAVGAVCRHDAPTSTPRLAWLRRALSIDRPTNYANLSGLSTRTPPTTPHGFTAESTPTSRRRVQTTASGEEGSETTVAVMPCEVLARCPLSPSVDPFRRSKCYRARSLPALRTSQSAIYKAASVNRELSATDPEGRSSTPRHSGSIVVAAPMAATSPVSRGPRSFRGGSIWPAGGTSSDAAGGARTKGWETAATADDD